jgi:hypothetical protein
LRLAIAGKNYSQYAGIACDAISLLRRVARSSELKKFSLPGRISNKMPLVYLKSLLRCLYSFSLRKRYQQDAVKKRTSLPMIKSIFI